MGISGIRLTLRAGAVVFGFSAIFLALLPAAFLELLGMDNTDQLRWSIRMIGITVFALAGNLWNNAQHENQSRVVNVARIMCVSAALLGLLTLLIPAPLTWFGFLYAAVGFSFSLAYFTNLIKTR